MEFRGEIEVKGTGLGAISKQRTGNNRGLDKFTQGLSVVRENI